RGAADPPAPSPGGGEPYLVGALEDLDEQLPVQLRVLHDQERLPHPPASRLRGSSSVAPRGRASVKVDPTPRELSTVTPPPSVRASRREIVSPRPVPGRVGEAGPSARWNSSKILPSSSAG